MRARTRRLLALLAEDEVDALLAMIGERPRSEPELRKELSISHAFLSQRLELLHAFGVLSYSRDVPGGRGRPARRWMLESPGLLSGFESVAETFATELPHGDLD
jgi:predicted ArsR family transcriptional regulator